MSIYIINILFELLNLMLGCSIASLLTILSYYTPFVVTILVVGKMRSSQLFEGILEK